MTVLAVDDLFASRIFPEFPFRNQNWIAVAFERNRYDNTRMPEWFFRAASEIFNPRGTNALLIKGDCFALNGQNEVIRVAFDWDSYRKFILSPEGFSLEYKIANEDGSCGCWADAELAVFGGESDKMTTLLNDHGGQDSMMERIEREFFLDDPTGNEDMRAYFRNLLFPDQRNDKK